MRNSVLSLNVWPIEIALQTTNCPDPGSLFLNEQNVCRKEGGSNR